MTALFHLFAEKIYQRFQILSRGELYTVNLTGDQLWEEYLKSFPKGSNPVYRMRTEHDCSCCRHFIRNIGGVISIINGKIESIWNVQGLDYPYNHVAQWMNEQVLESTIQNVFRTQETSYGAQSNRQMMESGVHTWHHFWAHISDRHYAGNSVNAVLGKHRTDVEMMTRALNELTPDSIQTVRELIKSNSLYRGEESLKIVQDFQKLYEKYRRLPQDDSRGIFIWENHNNPVGRIRNVAIGTLLVDLSEGVEVERAVSSFEKKVAPENYKRPTALITGRMIQDAMKTIQGLNLEPSLERRFARLSDVSINNVLWADNSAKQHMKGGIEDLLRSSTQVKEKNPRRIEDISIEEFVKNVLPTASSMDVLIRNHQLNNFMSLTAPVYEHVEPLFKWNNNFAWSYEGNVTDSIKERVKRAGGNVNAKLRVSLSWFNYDDLDLHCQAPQRHIYFGNKSGILDVDMNAGSGTTREPVENMAWNRIPDGTYQFQVNQYSQRETDKVGFIVEIEYDGKVTQLSYNKAVKGTIPVATLQVKKGEIVEIEISPQVSEGAISQQKWGIKTETLIPVDTIMLSPNHWDSNMVGNRHWFFILQGCKRDTPARGIYNEFLRNDLEQHRKVFEVLGEKTQCPLTDVQLSGVGFSSTQQNTLTVRVVGGIQRVFNINFGA